jgi:hypothetical protein
LKHHEDPGEIRHDDLLSPEKQSRGRNPAAEKRRSTVSNEKSTAEVKAESTAVSRIERIQLDPQALIQTALDKSAPVETLERLFELAKNVQAERARQAWYTAMAQFQKDCPAILKTRKADAGRYKFFYAPLSEIMEKISPVMGPLGLSVSYRVKHDGQRIIAVCRISHDMGHHEESGEVPIAIDSTTPGPSTAQRTGIASSYAKRYALLAITGIAPLDDEENEQGPATDNAGVRMPERSSAPETGTAFVWTGKIIKVETKTGKTNDRAWNLYVLATNDAQEFSTFDKAHADFARETAGSKVRITWEKTAKGGMKVLSIGPDDEGDGA